MHILYKRMKKLICGGICFISIGLINGLLLWDMPLWKQIIIDARSFFLLWLPAAMIAIVLDDRLRYWWFGEEKPHYIIWSEE